MDAIMAVALFATSLLLSRLGNAAAAAPPPMPPPSSCATAIILFSPCLPYVSSPPNDLDLNVTPFCCSSYSSALASGAGVCLCYLLREPEMLGFPLNNTRLFSLSSDCSSLNTTIVIRGSLETLCSASPPLPPLHDHNGGSDFPAAPDSSPASSLSPDVSPPPLGETSSSESAPKFAPETDEFSPDSLIEDDAKDSSATQRINTIRRSRFLASSVNMLLTIIVSHL